ncbi:hypothetical protein LRU_01271 [Ligilactobacillus ruminis SPM0211]|uniref:Uncharacterized protein n=1 Tax=Ligilactobacillus ruminis SPM0211 TaxID=1040964 RepID=F7R0E2_9LACO|nr:hypothetical protein LRU_01271 [Ligilactobacillus ruminis SPM0211]
MILLNAAPAQSARQVISQNYRHVLFRVIPIISKRLSCIHKKTGLDLRLIANHPVFQFEA